MNKKSKNNNFRNKSKTNKLEDFNEFEENQLYFVGAKHNKAIQSVILDDYCSDANIQISSFNDMKIKDFYTLSLFVSKGLSLLSHKKSILDKTHEEYLKLNIELTRETVNSKEIDFDKLNEVIKLISRISFDNIDLPKLSYLLYVYCFVVLENFDDVKKLVLISYSSDSANNPDNEFFSLLLHSKLIFGQYMNLFSRVLDKASRHSRKLNMLETMEKYEKYEKLEDLKKLRNTEDKKKYEYVQKSQKSRKSQNKRNIREIEDNDFFDEFKMMKIINDNMDNDIFKLIVAFFFNQIFSILVIISKTVYEVAYACDLVNENKELIESNDNDNNDDYEIVETFEIEEVLKKLDNKVKEILNNDLEKQRKNSIKNVN